MYRFVIGVVMASFLGLMGSAAETPKVTLQPVDIPMPALPPGVLPANATKTRPVPRVQAQPAYPSQLRAAHIEGEAIVVFTVRADGAVSDAVAVKATDVRFAERAVAAVSHWTFRPATDSSGKNVATRIATPVRFRLVK